ncbi:transposase zinc-binding domain-containing protein [Clostridium estertheticum]|nr:transposase zinc-binding domain-containing protein [Clostridium estertheticum]
MFKMSRGIKIGFTCKSRFCSKCGKKYISEWVKKQVNKILDVLHRHCVFTIPAEYRILILAIQLE